MTSLDDRASPLQRPGRLHEAVVARLRELVLDGTLVQGRRIHELRVAARLGTSATPVRMALLALEHEGYLIPAAGQGFYVALLTAEDLEDVMAALEGIEGAMLRVAGPPDARALIRLGCLQRRLNGSLSSPERWSALHEE